MFNGYNPQPSLDRINSHIAELERMKTQLTQQQQQIPNLTQNFQISPNQGGMKYAENLEQVGNDGLNSADIDYLFKVVDIYKDMKEVECMNNYGRYDAYGDYGRRGVDARYRGDSYMEGMSGSYRAYEESRNEYNNGNYRAKEDGLKELEYMLHSLVKFAKTIKEEANSPEEQEIVRHHFMKISEM